MTSSATKQKVQEALDKVWDLSAALKSATEEAQQARVVYNELRAQQDLSAMNEEKDSALEDAVQKSQELYDKALVTAQAKLDKAQKAHTDACQAAEEYQSKIIAETAASWDRKISEAQRQFDLLAAEAQVEAHTADQKMSSSQLALDRYCKDVKQQLGVDLKQLLQPQE